MAPFPHRPENRLAKSEPLCVMGFVRVQIMSFAAQTHWQDVIGKNSSLAPGGSEGNVEANELLISQDVDPRKPIRIRPHRVVDTREIDIENTAPFFEKMRK